MKNEHLSEKGQTLNRLFNINDLEEIKMNIEEMYKKTTIRKCGRNGERRFYKGKYWHRVLWDLKHPDQPCKDFDIHHKDFDKLNDNISNLERLTRKEHMKLHMTGKHIGKNNPMYGKHHTKFTKQKISLVTTGSNNPKARAVIIQGKIFSTRKEAAEYLNVSPGTIRNRILSNKFTEYEYI